MPEILIRMKKALLKFIDLIVGLFYYRYEPESYDWSRVKKVIIVRTDRVGDLVLSLPALRELKKYRPDINLTMVVSSYTKELLDESKIVDSLIIYKQNMDFWGRLKFISCLQREKYDLAIDMPFSRKIFSGLITFLTKARIKMGFSGGIKGIFLNCRISPQKGQRFEVERSFELLRYLMPEIPDTSLAGCISADPGYVKRLMAEGVIASDKTSFYVAIHPGAYKNISNRSWPQERFAKLADKLIKKYGAKVFFSGSKSREDIRLLESIRAKMQNDAVFIFGEARLRELYSLYGQMDLFISTFTGPLYLALSVGVPCVVLGGPTPHLRWMPPEGKNILLQADISCVPCNDNTVCRRKDYACMNGLAVNDVFGACSKILGPAYR